MTPAAENPNRRILDLVMELASGVRHRQETLAAAVLETDPGNIKALQILGRIRATQEKADVARRYFERAREFVDLSVLLTRERKYEEAFVAAERAIESDPVRAHAQLAGLYSEIGGAQRSMQRHTDLGLALAPDHAQLRMYRAILALGRGDFPAGWADLKYRAWHQQLAQSCPCPEWKGEPLEDKTLLVIGEEGMGDQVMYARFLPVLWKFHPQRILLRPGDALARLFHESFQGIEIVNSQGEMEGADVDYWIDTASLGALGLEDRGTVGMVSPYLRINPESGRRAARLLALLSPTSGRLRVGLVWAGRPEHPQDRNRSLTFQDFAPLLELEGVDFYSMQFGTAAAENDRIPDLAGHCLDAYDSAAMMENLDLLISVDTLPVHIAGALGKPVWVLVRNPIDWRWGNPEERNDWYPTVRQFRYQPMEQVAEALRELTK